MFDKCFYSSRRCCRNKKAVDIQANACVSCFAKNIRGIKNHFLSTRYMNLWMLCLLKSSRCLDCVVDEVVVLRMKIGGWSRQLACLKVRVK